jgi:putative intracellular protease/amidase
MFEPSLTVGLVPRIASRVLATHNYPTTRQAIPLPSKIRRKFADFVKVGTPLTAICAVVVVLLAPLIWQG